jgi:uncharacterized phage protein gp47/JayE
MTIIVSESTTTQDGAQSSSLGLAAKVTAAGISAPTYVDILATLQAKMREIFGADIYIEPDSKDGQLLAIVAQAIYDANDSAIATYNNFSPLTAQGAGLSSVVKTNGIARLVASYSTAVGNVVGQVGTVITNGVVKDANGNLWDLPASVTIPAAGQISVTVTAQQIGAISAAAGTINQIATPSLGWQSFTSTADATLGAPVERDAALRKRQAVSTSLPAQTPLGALQGALANLTGVTALKVYENTASVADANGIPGKAICVVIQGGDLVSIAQIIGQKKSPGAATYGTTAQTYIDPVTGIPYTINFYVLTTQNVKVKITGTPLAGYTSAQATAIQNAIVDYIALHGIGDAVEYTGLWAPAYQNVPALQQPYRISTLQVSTDGGATWNTNDVAVAFNKIALTAAADVQVTIA